MHLNSGKLLQGGKYRIESVLGQGGFGITYSAVQIGLDRIVAIKEFFLKTYCNRDWETSQVQIAAGHDDLVEKFRDKFIKEARTIGTLNHPHVVKIFDVFEENGTAYYVMEMLEPEDLSQRIPEDGFSESEALKYVRQIGDALSYVHKRRILHLDVKPSNVMFRNDGDAVLIDFGISKRYDNEGGQTSSTPIGVSRGYAPIEQFNQQLSSFSPATDVYSLAATLYKLLTGQNPPDASMVADDGLPPFPPKVSAKVEYAVREGMSPRRLDRPQSIFEFLRLLENATAAAHDETVFVSNNDETIVDFRPEQPKITPVDVSSHRRTEVSTDQPKSSYDTGQPKSLWDRHKTTIVMVVAIIIGFVGAFVLISGRDSEKNVVSDSNDEIVDFTKMGMYPMVKVKGGTFTMGSDMTDENDCPPHRVTLDDFYIGQFEVSQKFWKMIMGNNPSLNDGVFPTDSLPVDNVDYDDVQQFIDKLNMKTGMHFSLPSEAQWEYAARGGSKSTGKTFSGGTPRTIWFDKNRSFKVKKSDSVNELGLYQMSGNVAEWCLDYYDADYYLKSSGAINPVNTDGKNHIIRGGSYYSSSPDEIKVFYREADDKAQPYIGFRLVINM